MVYSFMENSTEIKKILNSCDYICSQQVISGIKDKYIGKLKWRKPFICFGHHIHSSLYCWAFCYDCGMSWCHCTAGDNHCCCRETYKEEYDKIRNQIQVNKTKRNKNAHYRKKLRKYHKYDKADITSRRQKI